ncbi:recombinase family protein [Hyphobacterium sp. SN044]|uniref:recombinase family protein n=1 Tax=Hyphobacterium sp. SN044 TaxID=2912575 RepID=UPI001F259ADD|nr:recombinase family protein [Hyphobacterium sp. SN044]MCF8880147.1 recombinase family protein [Hyphobacterium sp. SN044]
MSTDPRRIRCAIYTRKSTEEGLNQAFNSLDAQREACEAYIRSQHHEGWRPISKQYDDGGFSGGNLDRPALSALMADIEAGQVGMVVVYKIDRLTRSLADFSKLIEKLDAAGCSFVSVTQAFNTSSSMGRLTLNVLLSFAQFEREVTAERIRDKIAASKKKGMWMGGMLPLGYDLDRQPGSRRLIINAEEAQSVRFLFERYDKTPCLSTVEAAAHKAGIVSKIRTFESGVRYGGAPLRRGQVHFILTNPIYAGDIRHRDQVYPGQHHAIIDRVLFDRVQKKLMSNGRKPRSPTTANGRARSPLAGRLFDESGNRLTPTQTRSKSSKTHRYYVTATDPKNRSGSLWRLPANRIEGIIAKSAADHVFVAARGHRLLLDAGSDSADSLTRQAATLTAASKDELCLLVDRAEIQRARIDIELDRTALATRLGVDADDLSLAVLKFSVPIALKRRGVETRIIAGERKPEPDGTLVTMLAKAHSWVSEIKTGTSASTIAKRENTSAAYVRTRSNLAFLSPRIQEAMLAGTQPAELSLERIRQAGIPLDWDEQEQKFGFD